MGGDRYFNFSAESVLSKQVYKVTDFQQRLESYDFHYINNFNVFDQEDHEALYKNIKHWLKGPPTPIQGVLIGTLMVDPKHLVIETPKRSGYTTGLALTLLGMTMDEMQFWDYRKKSPIAIVFCTKDELDRNLKVFQRYAFRTRVEVHTDGSPDILLTTVERWNQVKKLEMNRLKIVAFEDKGIMTKRNPDDEMPSFHDVMIDLVCFFDDDDSLFLGQKQKSDQDFFITALERRAPCLAQPLLDQYSAQLFVHCCFRGAVNRFFLIFFDLAKFSYALPRSRRRSSSVEKEIEFKENRLEFLLRIVENIKTSWLFLAAHIFLWFALVNVFLWFYITASQIVSGIFALLWFIAAFPMYYKIFKTQEKIDDVKDEIAYLRWQNHRSLHLIVTKSKSVQTEVQKVDEYAKIVKTPKVLPAPPVPAHHPRPKHLPVIIHVPQNSSVDGLASIPEEV
uniref:Uncharacterized protein n=1 Tax=Panagrolaimus sp. JU765 TaxID=591449 RepID=A0AC34R804_9BILA